MRKLTKKEGKYLKAWRGIEELDRILRTDPRFSKEYERLIKKLYEKRT